MQSITTNIRKCHAYPHTGGPHLHETHSGPTQSLLFLCIDHHSCVWVKGRVRERRGKEGEREREGEGERGEGRVRERGGEGRVRERGGEGERERRGG